MSIKLVNTLMSFSRAREFRFGYLRNLIRVRFFLIKIIGQALIASYIDNGKISISES